MTTAPSTFHEWITVAFLRFVGIPAIEQGLAYVMTAPVGVLMPGCDPVQPDVVVVRKERASLFQDRRIRGVPDLIVEILSPSNAAYDLDIKLAAYARAGLPELAIIDPVERTLSLRRLAEPGPIRLAVADLFAGAPDETN
jgi:Uma2 family endonuclease